MEIPFLQARHYTHTGGRRVIDLIVVHDMEHPEEPEAAEQVARWFAGPTAPQASAHYCVDCDSRIQCVDDNDVAWHAPGANHNGIGIEHAGYARQSAADWADDYSDKMLVISAKLVAELIVEHKLPVEYRDADALRRGERGITTHHDVSLAFKKSTHTDPGPNFPMVHYLDLIDGFVPGGHMPEEQELVVNAIPLVVLTHASWPEGSYLLVCADGGVFPFGGAPFFGSLGATQLNKPIVDAVLTPSGQGYKMLGADGGDFNFGDAQFKGRVVFKG